MKISDFEFELPPQLIAQKPCSPRDSAKLLTVGTNLGDKRISDLLEILSPGDMLVFNDTKVIPCRLIGQQNSLNFEVTLHKPVSSDEWLAFAKPARKLEVGKVIQFSEDFGAVDQSLRILNRPLKVQDKADAKDLKIPDGIKPVVRFKSKISGNTIIKDLVQGERNISNSTIEDFVILRKDKTPTYQLSATVDDHEMKITHVIRGDDHMINSFKQKQIYDATELGPAIPAKTNDRRAIPPPVHRPPSPKTSARYPRNSPALPTRHPPGFYLATERLRRNECPCRNRSTSQTAVETPVHSAI